MNFTKISLIKSLIQPCNLATTKLIPCPSCCEVTALTIVPPPRPKVIFSIMPRVAFCLKLYIFIKNHRNPTATRRTEMEIVGFGHFHFFSSFTLIELWPPLADTHSSPRHLLYMLMSYTHVFHTTAVVCYGTKFHFNPWALVGNRASKHRSRC